MIKEISLKDKKLFNKLGLLLNEDFDKIFVLDSLLNNNYTYIFGYYVIQELVGFIHVDKSFDVLDVINIVVKDEYRNKGIATRLLDYAINYHHNIKKVLLEVKVTNINAINFYKKNNFSIINTRKGYYKGIDAYLMERNI